MIHAEFGFYICNKNATYDQTDFFDLFLLKSLYFC